MSNFSRGSLTPEVQEVAVGYLGREITLEELRLFPYIDFCLKNGGYADRSKMTPSETKLLHEAYGEDKLKRDCNGYIWVSEEFYNFIQKLLWLAYVPTKIEESEEA